MKVMVDITHEQMFKAYKLIEKKRGVCDILPSARFSMSDGESYITFDTLVCDDRMGSKQTGISAQYCDNCIKAKQ